MGVAKAAKDAIVPGKKWGCLIPPSPVQLGERWNPGRIQNGNAVYDGGERSARQGVTMRSP